MIPISILGAVAVPFMMFVEVIQMHAEHPEQQILLHAVYEDSILYMLLLANMMVSVAIASYLFSREYEENTWKTILQIPISRSKILVGDTNKLEGPHGERRSKFLSTKLKELGFDNEEISSYKRISLYDEILLNPNLSKIQ